ncbi:MAG: acid stress-induced BolA-like protein IbaG/YrbA [Cellvibrionaceae bacterium]|jgi:acid stress-induced BolA-like protein IbaG/YrbA
MDTDAIKNLLQNAFPDAEIAVDFEGSHLHLQVISDTFTGLSPVKRQQKIYAVLNEKIASGEIHAVNMVLSTP